MSEFSSLADFLSNSPDRGKWLNVFLDESFLPLPDLKKLGAQFGYVFVSEDVGFVPSDHGEVYILEFL